VAGAGGAVAGVARSAWRDRHVLKMLPRAFCGDKVGGLAGGEAKRAAWSLAPAVAGGCDVSHESAEGSSIFFSFRLLAVLTLPYKIWRKKSCVEMLLSVVLLSCSLARWMFGCDNVGVGCAVRGTSASGATSIKIRLPERLRSLL